MASDYELVQLRDGTFSLRSGKYGETFHPGVGPVAEGESLYGQQLRLGERASGRLVIWDVGLGGAANAITVLRSVACPVQLVSFDSTLEPFEFAIAHATELKYFQGYENQARYLLRDGRVEFGGIQWELQVGDFPSFLREPAAKLSPKPHAILYDPFSPAKNPEMWTQPLFTNLFGLLTEPCLLATYSRSTMVRSALLLAGFCVGVGQATGMKEETTVAANRMELIEQPLDGRWLERVARSDSAEPLWNPVFRRERLTSENLARLRTHPQFG